MQHYGVLISDFYCTVVRASDESRVTFRESSDRTDRPVMVFDRLTNQLIINLIPKAYEVIIWFIINLKDCDIVCVVSVSLLNNNITLNQYNVNLLPRRSCDNSIVQI